MGRRKERSGFGRRQVLQLNDSKREDSPYRGQGGSWPIKNEGNALSGLMAHYGESDVSEEEEEEAPPPLPEEPPPPEEPTEPEPPVTPMSNKQNGHATETENKGNISLDIDSKVANFLAEIDALDTDKPDDIDGEPMMDVEMEEATVEPPPPPLPEIQASNQASEESESAESDTDTPEAPVAPEAPLTVWQHCQDESTQYYYYWNTTTNEVTWEIPTEYSQYLLQLKEHDEAMARYEVKKTEYEGLMKEKKKSKKKKKTAKIAKQHIEEEQAPVPKEEEPPPHRVEKKAIKPWLLKKIRETYGDKYDTGQAEEEDDPPLPAEPTPAPAPEIGPQLPPGMAPNNEPQPEIGPQLPPPDPSDEDIDGEMMSDEPSMDGCASLPLAQQMFVKATEAEEGLVIGPMLPPQSSVNDSSKDTSVVNSKDSGVKSSHEDSRSKKEYEDDSDDGSEGETEEGPVFIGPQLPSVVKKEEKEQEEAKMEEDEDEDEEADLDFIDKQLEEPFMALGEKKKAVKKEEEPERPVSPPPVAETKVEEEEEDVEFDIDDIDQQLDMALEKKTAEQKTEKDRSPFAGKRKLSAEPEVENKKKVKLNTESVETSPTPKRKIDKEEIKIKAEVADLSTLITDKLEFLEVTRKGLSKLQILLVETETRISDWREGALGTRYLLGRLQDAELQLQQYESSAAPLGWACHWDRTYKRYFYFHTATGASQWDYPEDDGTSKDQAKSDNSSNSSSSAVESGDKADMVSSSLVDGDTADATGTKESTTAQHSLVDSTTFPADTTSKSSGASNPNNRETKSSSTEGVPVAKPSFPVDPSLFQDLFAPAPPPPSEPPPPGVELAPSILGPPRPPPGLPNSIPLSRSPPPPPPGTTPPHATTAATTATSEDHESPDVATMDPATTSLLAAAPPPPPPPEDVSTSTVNPAADQYSYSGVTGQAYISNLPSGAPVALPTAMVNPSTIIAQPVISSMPSVSSSTTTVAPPTSYIVNQPGSAQCTPPDTPPRTGQASCDTSSIDGVPLAETAPQPPQQSTTTSSTSQKVEQQPQQQQTTKEKKRKKEKKSSMGLSLKKKKLPSLVAKWQEVHEAVEREVSKHKKEDNSP